MEQNVPDFLMREKEGEIMLVPGGKNFHCKCFPIKWSIIDFVEYLAMFYFIDKISVFMNKYRRAFLLKVFYLIILIIFLYLKVHRNYFRSREIHSLWVEFMLVKSEDKNKINASEDKEILLNTEGISEAKGEINLSKTEKINYCFQCEKTKTVMKKIYERIIYRVPLWKLKIYNNRSKNLKWSREEDKEFICKIFDEINGDKELIKNKKYPIYVNESIEKEENFLPYMGSLPWIINLL